MQIKAMLDICFKDMRLLLSDKGAVFFTLFFPLIMATFFGTVFSGSGTPAGISIAIADQDQSSQSKAYIETLSDSDALRVQLQEAEVATEMVRQGKVTAVLIIPEGFGAAKESLFDNKTPTVQLGIDPSRKASAGMLGGILMAQAAEDMQKQFTDSDMMLNELNRGLEELKIIESEQPELTTMLESVKTWLEYNETENQAQTETGEQTTGDTSENGFAGFTPMVIEDKPIQREKTGPQNAYAISFPQGMVWGIIGAITTYSLALISEVTAGTLGRLGSAPISRMTILGGKALACFLTIVAICSVLILIAMFAFGVQINSPPLLGMTLLACGIGFSGLMMLLAVLGKTEKSAAGISWAIVMAMAMTGGGMIPLIAMPSWMAVLSDYSPIKWAVVSFEGIFWRQYDLMELMPYTLLLGALGIGCFTVGTMVFNRREIT
jgi:ABC-2 type transport system permease protein